MKRSSSLRRQWHRIFTEGGATAADRLKFALTHAGLLEAIGWQR